MAAVVEDLDSALQAMRALKPPGVSGSKIASITALCENNVQSESVIVQKIFTHFKRTTAAHKLGVLYVVDSVTRKWLDHAKKAGQSIDSSAADGSYAAGVNRISELLPILMNDIIQYAPVDQKEKIKKLIVIWERGNTFPATLLSSFQTKLDAVSQNTSTTPVGSPPAQDNTSLLTKQINPTTNDASSILESLANLARQNATAAAAASNVTAQDNGNHVSSMRNAFQPVDTSVNLGNHFPTPTPPLNIPVGATNMASSHPGADLNNLPPPLAQAQGNSSNITHGAALHSANAPGDRSMQQQMMLIQLFASQGVPPEQWAEALRLVYASGANIDGLTAQQSATPSWSQNGNQVSSNGWNGNHDYQSRDQQRTKDDRIRSPPARYRDSGRSRSRSPSNWTMNGDQSPARRRRSPDYGDSPGRRHGMDGRRVRDNGRGRGNGYRERSPMNRRHESSSPPDRYHVQKGSDKKWTDHDDSLGPNRIKVLSRTLFVGGVTCSESELRSIFLRFGKVQTCIVDTDKRHGFVKMITREDALRAKEGMEDYSNSESQLKVRSTRWGVGFGPRDCSDYQTGVSVIPVDRLTDADRKWMLTAENGGSGGQPIVSGMVVEEPDIEIGQGVSSKAISRRMVTNQSGHQGPKSSRGGNSRFRRPDRDFDGPPSDSVNAVSVPSALPASIPAPLPGHGFPLLQNGMPMFPPGFSMPSLPPPPPPQQ